LKGANILLQIQKNGESICKIADFGCDKELDEGARFNSFVGTAYFMAPEAIK